MTASLRLLVASVFTLTLVACGAGPTEVTSDGDAVRAASAAAPSQDAPATTAPAVKTTPLNEFNVLPPTSPLLSGEVKINGTVYDDSVYIRRCETESRSSYDLNRAYTKLQTVVGLEDGSVNPEEPDLPTTAAGAVTVTFSADDVVKSTVTPKLGVPVPVEIDLTNVLRLRIDVTGGAFCLPHSGIATVVAFGDARLTPKP